MGFFAYCIVHSHSNIEQIAFSESIVTVLSKKQFMQCYHDYMQKIMQNNPISQKSDLEVLAKSRALMHKELRWCI
jgi:hypothetical protein